MGMISEFKDFIAKGNAMDLAVGVIIGASFGAIVNSLVADVITPALLNPALKAAQVENLADLKTGGGILYGKFMSAVISFLIIAFVIFVMVKVINSLKTKKDAAVPATPTQEELLTQIRDLLKK
jgi:large conductance mechanosensitive channel